MNVLPAVEARGVSKVYGLSTVLHPTDFAVTAGEVRGLVGSNGAGKSTLMKILTGAIVPSTGRVLVNGDAAPPGRPMEMLRRGVACIYQHSNLVPEMSVLDNLYIGRQPTRRFGLIDRRALQEQAHALLARHGMDLDLDAAVSALPAVRQKEVEILKALALDARVLLMDEPTGWLSVADVKRLHATIAGLRSRGVGIVYISHVLDEVFDICDAVTVMRDGCVVADQPIASLSRARLIELMVGKTLASQALNAHTAAQPATDAEVPRLHCHELGKHGVFQGVSFNVRAGEILCLTGLVGSRRTELVRTIFGADRLDAGTIRLDGKPVVFRSPRDAIANGVGFVTEDRHRDGLMLSLSVAENLVAATLSRYRRGFLLAGARIRATARRLVAALNVQPPDTRKPVRLLSGGNQQKVLLGKWLDMQPRLLILDEPTVGVDIGAKAEIYAILRAERDKGMAILVVSSDLEEVMTIADRIAVMVSGRLVRVRDACNTQIGDVLRDMGAAAP